MTLLSVLNLNLTSEMVIQVGLYTAGGILAVLGCYTLLGVRYIPNRAVGVVEKLWSLSGSIAEGRMIVLDREAGFRATVLRGGFYFLYWIWQYRIHKVPLTIIPQGKIGYVFARDGEPLPPEQTLGRVVTCNNFQDAKAFLTGGSNPKRCGQRGRQRAILREGVYAINLAQFVVITEDNTYFLPLGGNEDVRAFETWKKELMRIRAFDPIVVGSSRQTGEEDIDDATVSTNDNIGILTVHDGPAVNPGEIIAPAVGTDPTEPHYHNNYQDIEAFLAAGGRRGRQLVPLTDGTYFVNRWFATVELIPKTLVPIGFVGVVVSYYGKQGQDLSGDSFRHGERVAEGARGVLTNTLCPGKYPFNTYAGHVHLVPTTNFVLHWITGRSESHKYDESLKSIDLVTADAYEPELPLSVVVHLDYQKAPSVIQRFGDIKKLITQTLDPMLSAYFRDIAHKKNMLELLHDRDLIQQESRRELRARFQEFDIELVDVLIGKPDTTEKNSKIETLLEQLRLRQLSREQIATFQEQGLAAEKLQALKMAQAKAEKQTELTNSQMEIQINENRGSAELAKARMQAEQTVVTAEAENKRRLLLADAESRSNALLGEGQSKRTSLEGGAEADVLRQKISSFADPKLYALSVVAQYLSRSQQPLVPERLFVTGGKGDDGLAASGGGLLSTLIGLLSAEKAGFNDAVPTAPAKPAANDPLTHNQPTTASRPLAEGKPIAGKM
jgi:uncharacterized membrane protein YqiK